MSRKTTRENFNPASPQRDAAVYPPIRGELRRANSLVILALSVVALAVGCSNAPGLVLRAPGHLSRALSVASDLQATAALVLKGAHTPLEGHPLTRGDDGITFSGFVDADPGQYTLEVTFTGIPATGGARHFLGRITSDSFTVSRGSAVNAAFSSPVDTLGRDGDDGDGDGDGLGFLDELLLGADPAVADSDSDGVVDGEDCRPGDPTNPFAIAAGGSVDDCDGDGFASETAPFGAPGNDCRDNDDTVHPGATDDCSDAVDQDCSRATCPDDDTDPPSLALVSPQSGDPAGCQAKIVVAANDPSGISVVSGSLPQIGGSAFLSFSDQGDGTWLADGLGFGSMPEGPTQLHLTAIDSRGNTAILDATLDIALGLPAVAIGGPSDLVDGAAVDITLTPTAGAHPLAALELHSARLGAGNSIDVAHAVVLGTVDPAAGGAVSVLPDTLGSAVLYAFARDDVGNELDVQVGSVLQNAQTNGQHQVSIAYPCDGSFHVARALLHGGGGGERASMRDHLQDAIDAAHAVDATAYLVKIVGFGLEADGTIDLGGTDATFQWIYGFMTPAQAQFPSDARGISVRYFTAGASTPGQNVLADDGGVFEINPMGDPAGLLDSDDLINAYPCGGLGWTGHFDDSIIYLRLDGENFDRVSVDFAETQAGSYSWGVHADDMSVDTYGCSCPDTVTNCP